MARLSLTRLYTSHHAGDALDGTTILVPGDTSRHAGKALDGDTVLIPDMDVAGKIWILSAPPLKLSNIEPGQYLDGRPPGNTGCY